MFEQLKKDKNKAFVIAEIGSNHCGSVDRAIELIKSAKHCGADAVKFQKRSNKSLFTKELYDSPYDNKNSYGKTYGEHREYLEFGKEEYCVLQDLCKEIDINFFATPFDFKSVDFLSEFDLPAYKIASADLIHIPLLEYVAKLGKPMLLSTGGSTMDDVRRAVDSILPINNEVIILHCTASYPALPRDMNLNVIPELIKNFPNQIIGLSDHENGAHSASIAYYLGARVFEKHFTLNRSWKGTDHSFSLEPRGLAKLTRNLSRIPGILGSSEKKLLPCEEKPLYKMRKSIVARTDLNKDTVLNYEHIDYKCPGGGLEPYRISDVIGKKLNKNLKKDNLVTFEDLYDG
jgi:N-acetylneuraminate synthase/sialic acid synthase